jgi:ElaB/YqjD/DUF883 family membrane-anchored ribosome-binding protein
MAEKTNLAPTASGAPGTAGGFEGRAAEARSAEEIRQNIAARRESISETVDRLSDRFQQTLDWRTYVADYPLVAVGVAVGVGFLLSGLFKPRPSPRERIMDAVAESIEDMTDRLRSQLGELPGRNRLGLGKTVKAALTVTLTKAAIDYSKRQFGLGAEPPVARRYRAEQHSGSGHAID